jgi:DNA-binding PadR family transcriptional regulator
VTRVFKRGELRAAILTALLRIEPANGYAIMQELADAIGGAWRPSPGAVYPAILGLEDAGLVVGTDDGAGTTTYRLSEAGRREAAEDDDVLSTVADRARLAEPVHTVGSLLDAFAASADQRGRRLDAAAARKVERALEAATNRLAKILEKETDDG